MRFASYVSHALNLLYNAPPLYANTLPHTFDSDPIVSDAGKTSRTSEQESET